MEFKQLEAFLHVAELGSFSKAAIVLRTTQPALSRLVRQLESDLQQHLLERNGRGVTLTHAGRVMFGHAKGITRQAQKAVQDMNELLGKPGGNVSVGLLPTVARLTASQLVRHFRATYPHAHISISEGLSANLTEWLMDGRIDVAVLYDTQHTPMIDKKPLFKQELFLIGPPGSSGERGHIQFARIGEVPLIVPGRIHGVRQTIEAVAAQVGIPLNIALEIDAVSTIFDMVQEGLGHAVQPMSVIRNDRQKRSFSIRSFKDPTPTLQLVLATSRRHPPSRLAEKISEMLEGLLSSSDMREP